MPLWSRANISSPSRFTSGQRLVLRNPDGTCIFEISGVLNFEFYSVMMSYGPGVKVLSPRIAVHCMKEKTKAMAKLYEETPGGMDGLGD